jgi:hypothetical protein
VETGKSRTHGELDGDKEDLLDLLVLPTLVVSVLMLVFILTDCLSGHKYLI